MTQELLGCPFCGSDPTPDYSSIEGENAYHFHCQSGECPAWPNVSGPTEGAAITAWNTRAGSATIPDPQAFMEAARGMREALEAIDTAFSEDDSTISCACDKALADGFTALLAFDAAQGEQ